MTVNIFQTKTIGMSRLDYITMAIVAICILAIVFLVYKMTDLFGGNSDGDTIENTDGIVELEDDTYDLENDPKEDLSGGASTDGTTAPAGGSTTTTTTPATTNPSTNPPTATGGSTEPRPKPSSTPIVEGDEEENAGSTSGSSQSSYNTSGKYMVIAGTFTQKALANQEAARLRGKGYENAKVEIFDKGKYAVVLVDRFNNMSDAERLTQKLQKDGVKAIVKTKQ